MLYLKRYQERAFYQASDDVKIEMHCVAVAAFVIKRRVSVKNILVSSTAAVV